MRQILVVCLLAASVPAGAQTISGGSRIGAGFWSGTRLTGEPFAGQYEPSSTTLAEKEVFVRATFRRLAFEAGFTGMRETRALETFGVCGTDLKAGYEFITTRRMQEHFSAFPLRAQYRINRTAGRINCFGGIMLAPVIRTQRETSVITTYGSMETRLFTTTKRSLDSQYGAELLFTLQAGKRLDIHSLLTVKINNSGTVLHQGVLVMAGAAYRI